MTESEEIEKRAQIRILNFLMAHLCNSELSQIGRLAVTRLIIRLQNEINDAKNETPNP
jgi:hypothetical protein